LIATEYFESKTGLNQYFYDSSYGNDAFKGNVIEWIDFDVELTADEVSSLKDEIITFANTDTKLKDPFFDLKLFDIIVLYV
jgi:hypothetical protein